MTAVNLANAGVTASGTPTSRNFGARMVDWLNAKDYGATGNGSTDDTTALNAAIAAALAAGKSLYVPAGVYKITSTLNFGSGGAGQYGGFMFCGDGDSYSASETGGTQIVYYGSSVSAILTINKDMYRDCSWSDFMLQSNTALAATYGIQIVSTELSQHRFERIDIQHVGTAIEITKGTGLNGEFFSFINVNAHYVNCFWESTAGQAYVHEFFNCGCDLLAGGTYFKFNFTGGGGGINVFGFSATGIHSSGPTNTTLVSNFGSDSCINFYGGRIEWLTMLYYSRLGSWSLRPAVHFNGLQITYDNVVASSSLPYFIETYYGTELVKLQSCQIAGIAGTETVVCSTTYGKIKFAECVFDLLGANPGTGTLPSNLDFVDCLYGTPGSSGVLLNAGGWGGPSGSPCWVSQLPASPFVGQRAYVTDLTALTFGITAVGGSNIPGPVNYNGTNWIIG